MPYLLCGLGNPGSRYADTRHNLGFKVLDALAGRHGLSWSEQHGEYVSAAGDILGTEVILLKPMTYMNRSGRALRGFLASDHRLQDRFLVVTDDFALPMGRLRLRRSGSPGNHNGLASISHVLGNEEFARLRIGIGPLPQGKDPADFVLEEFSDRDRDSVDSMIEQAADAIESVLTGGFDKAMNQYNRRVVPADEDESASKEVAVDETPPE